MDYSDFRFMTLHGLTRQDFDTIKLAADVAAMQAMLDRRAGSRAMDSIPTKNVPFAMCPDGCLRTPTMKAAWERNGRPD